MRFKDHVVAITGGNSGIGLEAAIKFAKEGARVAIFGRNQKTLDEAAPLLGEHALVFRGDVADLGHLTAFYEAIGKRFGKLDHLVANAGVGRPIPFSEVTEEDFDWHVSINIKGTFFTVQKALDLFPASGGTVVLVASTVHNKGWPDFTLYTATKAAMRSFARTMSRDLLTRKIRVNALCPGVVDTPLVQRMGYSDADMRAYEKTLPIQRYGNVEEMAEAICYMSSAATSYMLGSELMLDGGLNELGYQS